MDGLGCNLQGRRVEAPTASGVVGSTDCAQWSQWPHVTMSFKMRGARQVGTARSLPSLPRFALSEQLPAVTG